MAIVVSAIKWAMPSRTPVPLRLLAEIAAGAAVYAAVLLLLHRGHLGQFKRAIQLLRA